MPEQGKTNIHIGTTTGGRSEQTVGLLKSNGTEMVIGGTQAVSTGQTVNSAANALIPKKKREEDNQQQR